MECSKDAYPDIIAEEQIFLPETPRLFLAHVFKGKELSIKAAIALHCACPFTSWTAGANKVFGSRFLVYLEPSWLFNFIHRGHKV